jgi:Xaa-Pro aminopeptidase
MKSFPPGEAEYRLQRLQMWMQGAGVDAVLVLQNADLFYFAGTIQRGLLCLPSLGKPVYLVNKSLSRAKSEAAWDAIVPMSRLEDACGILEAEGIRRLRRVGLELDVLPAAYYFKLARAFPDAVMVDASPAIRKIRMVKSPHEVAQIKKAARMIQDAWTQLPAWIRPGITELEVLAEMERYLRIQGHQGIQRTRGFNYEVGYGAFSAGANACFPTSFPGSTGFRGLYPAISNTGSDRRLAPGEPLLVDISGGYGGYLADAARTFVLGALARDLLQAHELTLALNREIESMLQPGTECRKICERIFEKAEASGCPGFFMGAEDNHLRYVGHGVGLELDELPVMAPGSDTRLEQGMILAIEPKIFFPNRGGVGIENMYLITETGFEKLTPYREDVISVSIRDSRFEIRD